MKTTIAAILFSTLFSSAVMAKNVNCRVSEDERVRLYSQANIGLAQDVDVIVYSIAPGTEVKVIGKVVGRRDYATSMRRVQVISKGSGAPQNTFGYICEHNVGACDEVLD